MQVTSPVERYDYGDYGGLTVTDGTGGALAAPSRGNLYLFGGRRYDPETGLYYVGSRYLDPHTGRLLQRSSSLFGDRADPGNACTYEGNNPWSP